MSWLSVAACEVTLGPAALRQHYLLSRPINVKEAEELTARLFTVIDNHLQKKDWFVTNQMTIADIAMYPYIALSHQAKVSLESYKHIRDWLQRFQSLPNYVTMKGLEEIR